MQEGQLGRALVRLPTGGPPLARGGLRRDQAQPRIAVEAHAHAQPLRARRAQQLREPVTELLSRREAAREPQKISSVVGLHVPGRDERADPGVAQQAPSDAPRTVDERGRRQDAPARSVHQHPRRELLRREAAGIGEPLRERRSRAVTAPALDTLRSPRRVVRARGAVHRAQDELAELGVDPVAMCLDRQHVDAASERLADRGRVRRVPHDAIRGGHEWRAGQAREQPDRRGPCGRAHGQRGGAGDGLQQQGVGVMARDQADDMTAHRLLRDGVERGDAHVAVHRDEDRGAPPQRRVDLRGGLHATAGQMGVEPRDGRDVSAHGNHELGTIGLRGACSGDELRLDPRERGRRLDGVELGGSGRWPRRATVVLEQRAGAGTEDDRQYRDIGLRHRYIADSTQRRRGACASRRGDAPMSPLIRDIALSIGRQRSAHSLSDRPVAHVVLPRGNAAGARVPRTVPAFSAGGRGDPRG